jgi:transcriptional regulator with XRE-family HTH domain
MDKQQDRERLHQNLVLLVQSCSSVASLCRVLDINRQQFNKYLAGQHSPSQRILQKIARHFLMEVEDLYRAPADFKEFYEGFENDIPLGLRAAKRFTAFLPFAKASVELLRDYLGVYYRYHNSSIYKGRILRSVTCVYESNGTVQHVTIERFPNLDGSGNTQYSFAYYGFCMLLGDRIFMVDFEGVQRDEITFSILIPQHRRPIRYLHGLVTGVASSSFRQPFSTRLMLGFVEKGMIKSKHLRGATVLLPTDLTLPTEVRQYMAGANSTIIWGGEG